MQHYVSQEDLWGSLQWGQLVCQGLQQQASSLIVSIQKGLVQGRALLAAAADDGQKDQARLSIRPGNEHRWNFNRLEGCASLVLWGHCRVEAITRSISSLWTEHWCATVGCFGSHRHRSADVRQYMWSCRPGR